MNFDLKIEDLNKGRKDIVRVGVVQLRLDENFYKKENGLINPKNEDVVRNKYEKFLLKAKEHSVNILCFPEISLTREFLNELKNFADKINIIIIGGSFYHDRKNICPIIIPHGKEIYFTEKINLAPVEESIFSDQGASNGDKLYIIKNSDFGSFAVLICIDFLDDEIKNRIYREDIDFLFVISLNNKSEDFHIDMNRDCMKNKDGIYIVYSNSVAKMNGKSVGNGKSAVFGLIDELYLDKSEHYSVQYKFMEIFDEDLIVADFNIGKKQPTRPKNIHKGINIKPIYPYSTKKKKEILTFLNALGLEEKGIER